MTDGGRSGALFGEGLYQLYLAYLANTGFGFTPSHFLLTRCARPAGQPAAVTPLRYVGLRERESNQRESAPSIRVSLRETPLVPALLRGSSRWAIPGPSFLIWHPCQMPLCTAPPLGLLTGPGTEAPAKSVGAVLTAKLLSASRQGEEQDDIPQRITGTKSLLGDVQRCLGGPRAARIYSEGKALVLSALTASTAAVAARRWARLRRSARPRGALRRPGRP